MWVTPTSRIDSSRLELAPMGAQFEASRGDVHLPHDGSVGEEAGLARVHDDSVEIARPVLHNSVLRNQKQLS